MVKKYYLINLLLIVIIVFLVQRNYGEWTSPLPSLADSRRKTKVAGSSSPAGKREMPDRAVFRSVSDKNIFTPDRKEFPVPLTPEATKKPLLVRPNVELFGVVIGEGFHSAVITNPTRRADKGEREMMTITEGQKVGEYSVTKILPDRITLQSSGDSFDVLLYDPVKPKKRPAVAPTKSPTPPTPKPPPISTTPPRPYTPPAVTRPPVATPPPAVVNPPTLPGGTSVGTRTRPQIPPARIRVPPPRTLPVPDTDEEEEDDDDED